MSYHGSFWCLLLHLLIYQANIQIVIDHRIKKREIPTCINSFIQSLQILSEDFTI